MKAVPDSYVRELGQTARETGTAIEINASANLEFSRFPESYVKEYIEYLGRLKSDGLITEKEFVEYKGRILKRIV